MTTTPPAWCPTPRKIPHRTETAAIAAALSLSRRRGYGIRVYDCCDRGHHWHLTRWQRPDERKHR